MGYPTFLFLFSLVAFAGFSQSQDYSTAPKNYLGFSIGTLFSDVTGSLTQGKTAFTQAPANPQGTQKILIIPNQAFDSNTRVTEKLVFSDDRLYQVTGVYSYKKELLKSILDSFSTQYGPVRSNDGGYTYTWFYFRKDHALGEVPDFAVVVNSDPITTMKITVSFIDNSLKLAPPASISSPAPTPTPAAQPEG